MTSGTGIRVAALAVVLAALALAGWSLFSPRQASTSAIEGAAVADAEGALPAATSDHAAANGRPVPPAVASLPPPDAPLAQILPELVERADAGDRKAACRLGMELIRCVNLADLASLAMPENEEAPPWVDEKAAAALEEYQNRARIWELERKIQCSDVPPSLLGRGSHYLLQAARAGEPEAMVRYAEGQHWPPSGRGIAADPGFDAWRRDAAAMMHRALQAGAPEAAQILQFNYSDDFGWLSSLIPDDAEQALAMHLLTTRLFGSSENPQLSRNLSAGTVQRARERAEDLHTRYYQNRRFPPERRMPSTVYFLPSGTQAGFCE